MAEGKDQEICELKGKIVALEHKLRDFEYVMDQAMDNYIVFLRTQDAAITSYVKPPKTSKTLKSFMDDLIDKLVTMDSKIKDQAKSLHDAMCTNIEMEKKQKYIEDKISDMLTYSSLHDIKNMLKQLVIKHDYLMVPGLDFVTPKQMDLSACQLGVPIVNTMSMVTFNPIKIEAVDHVEAPSIVVDTDITVEAQDTSMYAPTNDAENQEIQNIITEIPLHERLVDDSYNIDDLDRLDQDNHNIDDLDRLDQDNHNIDDLDRLDQDNDNSDNVDTDDTEEYEPAKADNCIEGGNIDGELAIKKEIMASSFRVVLVSGDKKCDKALTMRMKRELWTEEQMERNKNLSKIRMRKMREKLKLKKKEVQSKTVFKTSLQRDKEESNKTIQRDKKREYRAKLHPQKLSRIKEQDRLAKQIKRQQTKNKLKSSKSKNRK